MTAETKRRSSKRTERKTTGPGKQRRGTKRPPRPPGRERPYTATIEVIYAAAASDDLYKLGAVYEHLGDPRHVTRHGEIVSRPRGVKAKLPPEAFVLFELYIGHNKCSEREAEANLRNPHVWEPVRAELAKRFPQYEGLAPGSRGPTRSQYHYWKSRHATRPGLVDAVLDRFIDVAVEQAKAMGMFDETHRGFTTPHLSDQIIGDGTVAKSMFNDVTGVEQWNPLTNQWELKRADPDARAQHHKDDHGDIQHSAVAGTQFGWWHAANGHVNETIVLDVSHIKGGPGNSEANQMIPRLEVVKARIGDGAKGVAYDKAMRGKQIDQIYDLGMVPHVKVAAGSGGTIKQTIVEAAAELHGPDGAVATAPLVAYEGQLHVLVDTGTDTHRVPVTHHNVLRRSNPGGKGRPYRWFIEGNLPDDPRLPATWRNTTIRARLDTTDDDRARKLNRAENLRAFHINDPRWSIAGSQRSRAEALFSRVKQRWANGRINAIGKDNQLLRQLGIALAINLEAALAYERRTGHPPSPS